MHGQVLDAGVGCHFIGDVTGGAAKPGELAFDHDRARRHPAKTQLTILVAIAATQIGHLPRVGIGLVVEPEGQGGGFATEQLIDRLSQPVLGAEPRHRDKTLGQVAQTMVAVGFPDPVRGGLGYCPETLFAGFQSQVAGLQALQGAVDFPRSTQGVAEEVDHQQPEHQHGAKQRRQHSPEQLIAWARRKPLQTVAGSAQGQARLVGRQGPGFFDAHPCQSSAGAQIGQFFRGQLVDENHHRGGLRVNAQLFIVRTDGGGHQHCRPAIEQYVPGDLLALGGNVPGLGNDRCQRVIYIGAGRCTAELAFEQGVFGAVVIDHEHPFKAAGGVQRVSDVLFFMGPLQVCNAIEVFISGIPYGVAGEKLPGRLKPLLQCFVRVEAAFFTFVGVERGGNVEQGPEGNQAGQGKQRGDTGDEFTRLQAGGRAGRRNLDDPVHTHPDPW
ncbi:hypothetical protein D3C77_231240 [compost metagenome]